MILISELYYMTLCGTKVTILLLRLAREIIYNPCITVKAEVMDFVDSMNVDYILNFKIMRDAYENPDYEGAWVGHC